MFETKYFCDDCDTEFYKMTEKDPRKVGGRCPACPNCKTKKEPKPKMYIKKRGAATNHNQAEADARVQDMIESRQAPSMGGTNNKNKAVDLTAEMVMKDYGMTDINMSGSLREGDNCVPKLRPDLEERVNNGFGQKKPIMGQQAAGNLNSALTRQINAGAFRSHGDVVARQQNTGYKVPTNFVGEYTGKT